MYYLNSSDEIFITAENTIICSVGGGLLPFMAVCYVFIFSYPVGIANLCIYLQKCMLGKNYGEKLPTSVISFVNDIENIVAKTLN